MVRRLLLVALVIVCVLQGPGSAQAPTWMEGRLVVADNPNTVGFSVGDLTAAASSALRSAGLEWMVQPDWNYAPNEWHWASLAHLGLPGVVRAVQAHVVFRSSGTSMWQYCNVWMTIRKPGTEIAATTYILLGSGGAPTQAFAENGGTWMTVTYRDGQPGVEFLWNLGWWSCPAAFTVKVQAAMVAD